MKKLLFILAITLSFSTFAQIDCKLINRVTLNVSTDTVNSPAIAMSYLRDSLANHIRIQIDTSNWHYFVFTKASNRIGKIYIDGVKVAEGLFDNVSYNFSQLYLAASRYTGYTGHYKGFIDELRVSDIVRTENEIRSHFNSGNPFKTDNNTVGLWHFDASSGTSIKNEVGANGSLINGPIFLPGKFSNAVYFDGIDDRGDCNINIPENNITIEFWAKLDDIGNVKGSSIIQPYGVYSADIRAVYKSYVPSYVWSNGDTTSSITIDPSVDSIVWVTDGFCTDTMIFKSTKVYDTILISVQDTLIINAQLAGTTGVRSNQISLYPNPASEFLVIDFGDYNAMAGYEISIVDFNAKEVHRENINSQNTQINLSNWSGEGLYLVNIIDPNGVTIESRKIVIQ